MEPLCVYGGLSCFYTLPLIFGSFIPDMAVPATNLVVCNKVYPYRYLAFHVRAVNTYAKRECFCYKLQCMCLTDCSQRCVIVEQVALLLCSLIQFLSR